MILRRLKHATLQVARETGVSDRIADSRWRSARILILCYHGVSAGDEHVGSDAHVSPDHLRSRLELLRKTGCTILPLVEAVRRLFARTLPPRSVVITFDDGLFDFHACAYGVLQEFGVHATLYVSTYHTAVQLPVFDHVIGYLLHKAQGRVLETSGLTAQPRTVIVPRWEEPAHAALYDEISTSVQRRGLSVSEKDRLVRRTCQQVGVDYNTLCARRQSHLMTREELRSLSPRHVDVQLHTHRHRAPRDKASFVREIEENRAALADLGRDPKNLIHFCYPDGTHAPEFLPWLRASGVESATTCHPGMASPWCDPLLLPRLVDSMRTPEEVLLGWVTGAAAFLPQRRRTRSFPLGDFSSFPYPELPQTGRAVETQLIGNA
jgi:peptidoglycan/xylan/chitin deacetylase (PgdA/CDA1 family)